jgi:PA14 domain/Secretion system C-terminal sorting domain
MRACQLLLFVLFATTSYAQPKISVVTQHNDHYRSGWNKQEFDLNPTSVSSPLFGLTGSMAVDDQVYAQPLVVKNLHIGSYTGTVLFVATVNNSIYAFNADDVTEAIPLWQVNLNPPAQRSPDIFDLKDPQQGAPCGGQYRDFSGKLGTVGTPVIDTIANTLYVATKTIDASGNFNAYLNAINILTGAHRPGSPKLMQAEIDGQGEGSVNGKLNYLAKYQNQRPALLLLNSTVYIASASHCDWGPYHGWILAYDAVSLNLKYTYNATPNGWAGGIWMAGEGISVGDDGNLYVVTGNGTTSSDNNNFIDGRSESLIKLSPQLKLLDWFTPANYQYLDDVDLDYGSDGALIIPNTPLTISGSKEGISYVVDYNKMGKFDANNTLVKDTLEFNPNRQGYVHVHGSPIYAGLDNGEFVYAWAETFKIRQFPFNRSTSTFSKSFLEGKRNLDNGMPGAMLSISSAGNASSSAIVWACFPSSGNANNQVRPGTLAAYYGADVSKGEIWNSAAVKKNDIGDFAKFNTPTVANGKVYVPTFSNAVKVYGLLCNAANANLQPGIGNGLKASYFTGADPAIPFPATASVTRLDKSVNFNWGASSPDAEIKSAAFKAKWLGKLLPYNSEQYTIYLTASDGVRLWINEKLVVDSWSNKNITTHTAIVDLQKNAENAIRLEYYSQSSTAACILQWSSASVCKEVIPPSQLLATTAACDNSGTGLTAEYYSNTPPGGTFPPSATTTTITPTVDFDWAKAAPTGISDDNFKARFSGSVQALDAGIYTFYLSADDGIRLWVDGHLLIDAWKDQGTTEYSATISLQECKKYSILIEFYENGGDAVCKLEWKTPVTPKQAIPTGNLYPQPAGYEKKPFLIYPNPVHETLTILSRTNLAEGDQLLVYNMLGQLVARKSFASGLLGNTVTLPVSQLRPGLYALKLVSQKNAHTAKFIKQ